MRRTILFIAILLMPLVAHARDGQTGATSSGEAHITLVIPERIAFAEIENEETHKTETVDISTVEYDTIYVEVFVKTGDRKFPVKKRVPIYVPSP